MNKIGLFSVAALLSLLVACVGKPSAEKALLSGLDREAFVDTVAGQPVGLYTLTNAGMEVCITNYGGRVVSIMVPDRDGTMRDVVLGFDSIADYEHVEGNNFGGLIGRYGNRIEQGRFTLDGKTFQLPQNNYGHSLHGGPEGFHTQVWTVDSTSDAHTLVLHHRSPDGFAGYPGNLDVTVRYTVTDDNALEIAYEARTDAPTIVNLTNHSYFNLGADHSRNILDHEVMIAADSITPIDSTFMTHGTMMAVTGTPFDFGQAKTVGRDIEADHEQLRNGHGYDHNFVLRPHDGNTPVASIYCPSTGIMMEVFSPEPGLQFYVGNFLDGTVKGKRGVAYPHRGAICMETQHYPNSPNCASYPSTVLRPGEVYQSLCRYRFSVR